MVTGIIVSAVQTVGLGVILFLADKFSWPFICMIFFIPILFSVLFKFTGPISLLLPVLSSAFVYIYIVSPYIYNFLGVDPLICSIIVTSIGLIVNLIISFF